MCQRTWQTFTALLMTSHLSCVKLVNSSLQSFNNGFVYIRHFSPVDCVFQRLHEHTECISYLRYETFVVLFFHSFTRWADEILPTLSTFLVCRGMDHVKPMPRTVEHVIQNNAKTACQTLTDPLVVKAPDILSSPPTVRMGGKKDREGEIGEREAAKPGEMGEKMKKWVGQHPLPFPNLERGALESSLSGIY